jgi:phosphatidylglycerophosphatase A
VTAAARPRFAHPAVWLSTWFGIGYVPLVGQVVAAVTALPIAWLLLWLGGSYGGGLLFIATTVVFWTGLWAVSLYCRTAGADAPRRVVVDNVVGQWLPLMFVRPDAAWQFAIAFVLFRVMDVLRPWPVSWARDHLPGGWRLMLDDFFAGVYAAACMYVIVHLAEHPYVVSLVERTL